VWLLLADLRGKEARLANNLLELERAREQLLREERLAAVGRVSSAIAHEIRNPVAMIASAIATAKQLTGEERDEMFAIAADEANRLSNFAANDFDVVITDQKMPDGEGLTVLASARENDATPGGGSVDGRGHD